MGLTNASCGLHLLTNNKIEKNKNSYTIALAETPMLENLQYLNS